MTTATSVSAPLASAFGHRVRVGRRSTVAARATLASVIALAMPLVGCGGAQKDGVAWSSKNGTTQPTFPSEAAASNGGHGGARNEAPVVLARPTPRDQVDAQALRAKAIDVAHEAMASSSALLRAHAIEALVNSPHDLDSVVGRGLVDENRGVRFVAALAIAKTRRVELVHLVEPLLRDDSLSVRAAAIAALATCGRRPDLTPLASMIRSEDTEVRGNAYLALGVIGADAGGASAIPMVRESVGQGLSMADSARIKVIELQAAECLVRLGRSEEIEPIRAALFAPAEQNEVTALACQMIGRLKDARSRPMLERLIEAERESARPPEIRLAAMEAIARIGVDPSRILPLAMQYLTAPSAGQRAQACLVVGAAGDVGSLGQVEPLLADRDPVARLAAAAAVLESLARR